MGRLGGEASEGKGGEKSLAIGWQPLWMVAGGGLKVGRRFTNIARPPMREIHAITPRNAPIPQPLVVVMTDIRMQKSSDSIWSVQEHFCHAAQQLGAKPLSSHRGIRCQGADTKTTLAEAK